MNDMVEQLLQKTHDGPVFGPGGAFGPMDDSQRQAMQQQVASIAGLLQRKLYVALQKALPEASEKTVAERTAAIVPKASCFCPALTAMELPGSDEALSLTALAIGLMYAADEGTDRGDTAMLLAIERFRGEDRSIPAKLVASVRARTHILQAMKATIDSFALPDDAPHILECYDELVLHNEARLHRLSKAYDELQDDPSRKSFLAEHGKQLATLMVADAGFQSVTASLHTLYRRGDPSLPSIAEAHGDPQMAKLIQICNTVARVADERGDWWMDAGNDPSKGLFTLNPLNQYDPTLVRTLCELACLPDDQFEPIRNAFEHFHDSDEARDQHGAFITDTFFAHARDYINNLPADFATKYERYVVLCKRVLEISHVNMMGDITMGAQRQS